MPAASRHSKQALSAPADAAALIIAGGRGTRFWPESRLDRPKPLFSLDGKTPLLAATVARMMPLIPRERVFVLASAEQAPLFRPVLNKLLPRQNLIVEPAARGTAVAIAYGSAVIGRRLSSETVVAVMPADHHVSPVADFQRTIWDAIALAAKHASLVVIGIRPTRPETGYGYLKIGRPVEVPGPRAREPLATASGISGRSHIGRGQMDIARFPRSHKRLSGGAQLSCPGEAGKHAAETGQHPVISRVDEWVRKGVSAFKLDGFVEKPAAGAALRMVKSGNYLWNAGMFVMSVGTLASELAQHAAPLAMAMNSFPAMRPAELERKYRALNFDAFDRVVAEKSRHVLGVYGRFTWHDVGSWEGLWEALRGDSSNVFTGNILEIGAHGVLARASDHLMVLLGVKDIVAIETGDVILIADRRQSQDVRKVIDELKRRRADRYL